MSKNESRKERRKQNNQTKQQKNNSGIGKIFYWIIGILFLILILLIVFVFARSGNKVDIDSNTADSEIVEENNSDKSEEDKNDSNKSEVSEDDQDETSNESEEDTDENNEDENEDESEDEDDVETSDDDELSPGDSTTVNDDAPHESDYVVNYNEGSSDRVAIKNKVIEATELNDDLIEWWVGNDGAGKVVTTVSSRDKSKIYQVHLQYGDGDWHVTSFERLNELP